MWVLCYALIAAADGLQNNAADDTELYATGQNFLNREEDVIGSVIGYVPLACTPFL
jgi:hypothetical protein